MKTATFLASLMLASVVSTSALVSMSAFAAGPPQPAAAAKPKGASAPVEPAQQAVEYADLAKYLNKRIIVRSKLNTTRAGVLTRYSASEIDLKLDSGADLSMPATSIKSIGIPIGPADPLFPKVDSKVPDAKASDVKPADAKPGEVKPIVAKPAENKPVDAKASSEKASGNKADAKPSDAKPSDAKSGDGKTGDSSAKKN